MTRKGVPNLPDANLAMLFMDGLPSNKQSIVKLVTLQEANGIPNKDQSSRKSFRTFGRLACSWFNPVL